MFDKKQFALLLKKAIGNNSIRNFASQANIDRSHLSKHLNKKFPTPYQPEKLQRIADASEGRVTYEELMMASGYIKSKNEIILENIKLVMGKMSYDEFSQAVGQKLGSAYSIAYPPSYFKDILLETHYIDNNGLSMLAKYAEVEQTFFIKENTIDDYENAKEVHKKLDYDKEKTTSTINDYLKLIKTLISQGVDMDKYKDIFNIENIKYLDLALENINKQTKSKI